jgi:hypothetical protein
MLGIHPTAPHDTVINELRQIRDIVAELVASHG